MGELQKRIPIVEIFLTIQGEGALIGKPTVFVRTGGCEYRCSWCDSLYAVLPEHKKEWSELSIQEIFTNIQQLSPTPILVTLSGGNPAIHQLGELIDRGHEQGYTFAMETQGSVCRSYMARLDYLTLSPKGPSSGMKTRFDRLDACMNIKGPSLCLKVVILDEADYEYAHSIQNRYPTVPLYLQVGNDLPPQKGSFDLTSLLKKFDWLVQKVAKERWNNVTVLPQLHTILWGNERGV